jgi:hypothetical protein
LVLLACRSGLKSKTIFGAVQVALDLGLDPAVLFAGDRVGDRDEQPGLGPVLVGGCDGGREQERQPQQASTEQVTGNTNGLPARRYHAHTSYPGPT